VLVGTLALNFPIQTVGDVRRYPSDTLPGPVYYPLYNSYIRQSLNTLWGPNGNTALRVLLIPDQQHLPAPAARRR